MKEIPICPTYKIECANANPEKDNGGCNPESTICQITARLNAQMAFELDDENIVNYRPGSNDWRYAENYDYSEEFEQGDPY
jgi:hypothetical protein